MMPEPIRPLGFSFEFGGLQDGERSKDDLMIEILDFFEIQGLWTSAKENKTVSSIKTNAYPNPFTSETVIRFETARNPGLPLTFIISTGNW